MTDHSSVLFNVDLATGVIGKGFSNAHWYKLGLIQASTCPWLPLADVEVHPDEPNPKVSGQTIPDMEKAIKLVLA